MKTDKSEVHVMPEGEESFTAGLSQWLRDSERDIPVDVQASLGQRRAAALELNANSPETVTPWRWQAFGGIAAAALVLGLMVVAPDQSSQLIVPDDADVVAEEGPDLDPEFFEQMEFYEWLAAQEV